ncbi:MAG: ribonuclease HI family protein [bacterium]|nr:ribonuclease HI family protein [bacterium]
MTRNSITELLIFLRSEAGAGLDLSAPKRVELLDWLTAQRDALSEKRSAAKPKAASGKAATPRAAASTDRARSRTGSPPAGACALLHCDGASRGNPGPASAGFVIYLDGEEIYGKGEPLGRMTNNQAEYNALLLGLEAVKQLGFRKIEVALDSELIVRQIEGRYKVKNQALKPLFEKARLALYGFESWRIRHVPRKDNAAADALANEALDAL